MYNKTRQVSLPRIPAALVIALVLLATAPSSSVFAVTPLKIQSDCNLCEYSAPELWVVNSRCAPRCCGLDQGFEKITYERWDADCQKFVKETRESFLAHQADIPTLLFSHGNTLTHERAMENCWQVYNRIKVCPGPKMLVFWSWPAQVVYKRPLIRPFKLIKKNIKASYVYCEYQGYYIAKLTNMMSTAQPLTLSGHSYGGVTVICALHFLGGGSLNSLVLDGGAPDERYNLRAAIVSGAIDNDSMYPGYRYGQSFAPVETFYTTWSDRDATLKRWPNYSFRGRQALGYTGICASRLGPYAHKLFQQKLTEDVKKSHYLKPHLASTRMISAICKTAFNTNTCNCPSCSGRSSPSPMRSLDLQRIIEVPAQTLIPGLGL